jgi:hypothetical protein
MSAALAFGLASPAGATDDLVALLLGMEAAYARVTDYTARFMRRERVGGTLRPREEVLLKFQRPGRIYLRWVAGPRQGREILFVKGRDEGKILVHEPGAVSGLFTYVMAPDSPRVLKESRHPVSEVGLGRLIELLVSNTRRARERGELTLLDRGVAVESGRRVRQVEGVLPRDPGKGYYCYRTIVTVDLEWELPVAATIFDWDDQVVAEYAYRELRLNPGLRDSDFDPANPEYAFSRWRLAL